MGIASLVSTGRPEVLDRLSSEVCNLWLDVFSEIKEAYERAESEEDPYVVFLFSHCSIATKPPYAVMG